VNGFQSPGEASILTDRAVVHKYYSPALKAWLGDLRDGRHDGGPDDPRIRVIKVKVMAMTYAVSRNTMIGHGIEMVKGIITVEAPSVNKLRDISEGEPHEWRSSH
jgi:general stress protein 26